MQRKTYYNRRYNQYQQYNTPSYNIFKYPFSNKTLQAKIPDGTCTLSSGERFTGGGLFTLNNASYNYFVLTPTPYTALLSSGPIAYPTAATDDVASTGASLRDRVNAFPPSIEWGAHNYQSQLDTTNFEEKVNKYRYVSAGMKITYSGSTDKDDGFFEACRVNFSSYGSLQQALTYFISGGVHMIEQNGYVSGKLRDIQKYEFRLKPSGGEVAFISGSQHVYDLMDMVIIKVSACNGECDLLINTVANIEFIYNAQAPEHRNHTESKYDKTWNTKALIQEVETSAARKLY